MNVANPDPLVHKAKEGHLDHQENLDFPDLLDQQDPLDLEENGENLDSLVPPDQLVHLV